MCLHNRITMCNIFRMSCSFWHCIPQITIIVTSILDKWNSHIFNGRSYFKCMYLRLPQFRMRKRERGGGIELIEEWWISNSRRTGTQGKFIGWSFFCNAWDFHDSRIMEWEIKCEQNFVTFGSLVVIPVKRSVYTHSAQLSTLVWKVLSI